MGGGEREKKLLDLNTDNNHLLEKIHSKKLKMCLAPVIGGFTLVEPDHIWD